ncbi:MAG: hypothetical protein J7L34_07350 [Thermotogaceae bacterium]|nr:hypothetical protein [Thermotogaceae bacterium]
MIRDTVGFGLSQLHSLQRFYPVSAYMDVLRRAQEDLRQEFIVELLSRGLPLENLPEGQEREVLKALDTAFYHILRQLGWRKTRKGEWMPPELVGDLPSLDWGGKYTVPVKALVLEVLLEA